MSLCDVSYPHPAALIREFYSNISIHSDDSGGHYLTTWIGGEEFQITKKVVSDALNVPLVRRPVQMKNAEPSTATSKWPKVEASTTAPTTSD